MHPLRFARASLAVAAVALASCTLDYDTFTAGEGGGTSVATSGTTTTGSTSVTTTASTSDASSSSSGGGGSSTTTSSASAGGGGQGGQGGQGGNGPILPCPGLALSFEPDDIDDVLEGSAWEADLAGGGSLDTDFDRLVIDVDGRPDDPESAEIRTINAELFACSVTVELHQFDAAGEVEFPAVAYFSAIGDWGGSADEYAGLEVVVTSDEDCEIGARLRGDAGFDGETVPCDLPIPGVYLRLTHTGEALCQEVSRDGGGVFETLHCRPTNVAHRVALGATTVENVEFFFRDIN